MSLHQRSHHSSKSYSSKSHSSKSYSSKSQPKALLDVADEIASALRENPNLSYLLDGVGIVSQQIHADEPGRIKYQHSYWNAIAWDGIPLLPGTRVRVVGVNNITLIVSPVNSPNAQTPAFGLL